MNIEVNTTRRLCSNSFSGDDGRTEKVIYISSILFSYELAPSYVHVNLLCAGVDGFDLLQEPLIRKKVTGVKVTL